MNDQSRVPAGNWNTMGPPRSRTSFIVVAVVLCFLIVFGTVFALLLSHANAVYAEFMAGCERDHKHYECMLLWRATRRDDPTVVPIPSTR